MTPVDLRDSIDDAVAATGQLFNDKNVALETDVPADAPPVIADADRVLQVLINLLSNAVKFCEQDSGRVHVGLARHGSSLRVEVRDNGPGVSRADQQVIFEKFRQAADAFGGRSHGTGLGLAISRQIIARFGGRLWVESEPGRGATFIFTIPCAGSLVRTAPLAV
jgi:signal transduction histidine kinase